MIDRGIIKWQPFNSCFNSDDIIKDINENKNDEKLPVLSEDQINLLEKDIKKAYNLNLLVNIKYYYNGKFKNLVGKIKYFDFINKKIYINNQAIYFCQILKIWEAS